MKRGWARALGGLAAAGIVALGAGALAWSRTDVPTRQEYRIRALDLAHSLGLGLPRRDLAHLRERSGLSDVSNVSCRNCHGATTNALPWARPRPRHPAPAGLAVSEDGRRLYVSLPDLDEVVEAEVATLRVLRRTRVSGAPTGLALAPGGRDLFVSCRNADRVARLEVAGFAERESADVGVAPVGIAVAATPEGIRIAVANTRSDDLSLLGVAPFAEEVRLSTGREPYGVGVSPDGTRVFTASRLATMPGIDRPPAAELTVVDAVRRRALAREPLVSAHLSEAVLMVPGRGWVLAPLVRVRNLVPITQVSRGWVMSAGLAVIEAPGGPVVQVPVDEANRYFADPAGLAVSPDGRRAYLASAGGDAVSVIDLDRLASWLAQADPEAKRTAIHDLELSSAYVVARIATGRNPRQIALSPDGSRLFVAEYLEDAVRVIDTATLATVGHLELGDGRRGMEDPVRRGERLFTWAGRTFQGQFSCRSCHPDGHVDGLNYDFDGDGVGDNLLDNRSLRGVAGTWPFKWNGKNPSLSVQCGPRFAKVLMRTDPFEGPELEDLTRFVESMPPERVRGARDTGWTEARERGRQIFFATATPEGRPIPVGRRCSTCHPPPLYTHRAKSAVGTRGPQDPGDQFDTPHLLGIGASAPYLHDGRARTLEELWTRYQTNDLHGVSSYMSKPQLNDLVEFLKTL